MKKTNFESFCNKHVCRGCKFCVRGEKLVLFVGGKCSRNCWYCSLSKNRKNSPIVYANEKPVKYIADIITEARESNSCGAGITGGDPFLYFDETLSYARALKSKFGSDFHIHIYLPPQLVDKKKLLKISKYIDEVRFHPSFLIDDSKRLRKLEIKKIKMASEIYGKRNCGIELPCLEEKSEDILEFIGEVKEFIGFCNLNEFEISETNFDVVMKDYKMNEDTYTISGSVEAGKWIIDEVEKSGWDVPVHLCTAKTKDCYQYVNRLLKHNILPYGNRTDEGTVVYFAVYYEREFDNVPKGVTVGVTRIPEVSSGLMPSLQAVSEGNKVGKGKMNNAEGKESDEMVRGRRFNGIYDDVLKRVESATKNYYDDVEKGRVIIDMKYVEKVYSQTKLKIARIEEHPTYNADYLEFGYIDE